MFLCTTLIRLLPSSLFSPAWNKYTEVSKSERSWEPTSCATSQLQRVRLFFSSSCNAESCGYGLQLFFSEVTFSGCRKVASVFFSSVPFYRVLANTRTTRWALAFSQETDCRGSCVICTRVGPQPSLVWEGASGMLRSLERKISRDFLRT